MDTNTLSDLGWTPTREGELLSLGRPDWVAMRVVGRNHSTYRLLGSPPHDTPLLGRPSGRLRHLCGSPRSHPVVGDWVAVTPAPGRSGEQAVIHAILPRGPSLVRSGTGLAGGQVLAANVDLVLVVVPVDRPLNTRRLERSLTLVGQAGASPLLVLSKADACPDPARALEEARGAAPGTPVLLTSALEDQGVAEVAAHLGPGRTAVLLGASGAGKSSLVNALLGGEHQATLPVREGDGRGRHTTTSREAFLLPGGGLLLDTPGLRAVGLFDDAEGLTTAFPEIEEWVRGCRFRNCQHHQEPGCRIREALEQGELDPKRWQSFQDLDEEVRGRDARHRAARARDRSRARQRSLRELEERDRGGAGRRSRKSAPRRRR